MYIAFNNFKYGLDTRRSELSSIPGSLLQAINGHITQGGSFEKRKAFSKIRIPSNCYGAQETLDGIVVFGTRPTSWAGSGYTFSSNEAYITVDTTVSSITPEAGDSITIAGCSVTAMNGTFTVSRVQGGTPVIAVTHADGVFTEAFTVTLNFPTPVIFQAITYPDPVYESDVTLVDIVSSTYFNGKTFAVAQWTFGGGNYEYYAYYDGVPVLDFYSGAGNLVEIYPQIMASDFISAINASGKYTATLQAPADLYFKITGGTVSAGVNKITQVTYNFNRTVKLVDGSTGSSFTFLAFGSVDYNTDNNTTTTDVKTQMDASNHLGASAFTITKSANKITIVPPALDFYGDTLGVQGMDTVEVTVGGDVTIYIPDVAAVFDVTSIPTEGSTSPFSVSTVVSDATLDYKLVSSGVPAIGPVGAVGQFQIAAGGGNAKATGVIATSTLPINGSTITVGSVTYTFISGNLTTAANEVKIGATTLATLQNLVAAINRTSGAGTTYSSSTVVNPDFSAAAVSGTSTTLTATIGGTIGNSLTLSQSGAYFILTTPATTATGGPDTNVITSISVAGVDLLQGVPVPFAKNIDYTLSQIVAGINANSGTTRFSASVSNQVLYLIADDPGASYNYAAVSIVVGGNVCIGKAAVLVSGAGNISQITANATNLMTATITKLTTETLAAFAVRVVANINANSGVSGYVAYADGVTAGFNLGAITTTDTTAIDFEVTATITIGAADTTTLSQTNTGVDLTASGSIKKLNGVTYRDFSVASKNPSTTFTAIGGMSPYSFSFVCLSQQPQLTAVITSQSTNSCSVRFDAGPTAILALVQSPGVEQWNCVIKDSTSPTNETITVLMTINW